jgi:hypothetical protein
MSEKEIVTKHVSNPASNLVSNPETIARILETSSATIIVISLAISFATILVINLVIIFVNKIVSKTAIRTANPLVLLPGSLHLPGSVKTLGTAEIIEILGTGHQMGRKWHRGCAR